MSFNTITIERRQPILNKKYVKIPGAEDTAVPLTVSEAETGIDNPTDGGRDQSGTLNFGFGERRNIIPVYQMNNNLDFLTYEAVGLDGKVPTVSGAVADIQEELRETSEAKY